MAIAAAPQQGEASHTLRLLPRVPSEKLSDPAYQAYLVLRTTFVVAPILFGVDKFFNWMTYWPKYLWVSFPHFLSMSPQHFMYGAGVIVIVAGLGVLVLPRLAPYVVAGWLGGIITNEIILSIASNGDGGRVFWDIALRDFGLMIAAFALARLAAKYAPRHLVGTERAGQSLAVEVAAVADPSRRSSCRHLPRPARRVVAGLAAAGGRRPRGLPAPQNVTRKERTA